LLGAWLSLSETFIMLLMRRLASEKSPNSSASTYSRSIGKSGSTSSSEGMSRLSVSTNRT
jgi:hypothetical protein